MSVTTDEWTSRDRISFLRTLRAVRSFRPTLCRRRSLTTSWKWHDGRGASNKQPWEITGNPRAGHAAHPRLVRRLRRRHLAGAPLGIVPRHGRRAGRAGDLR